MYGKRKLVSLARDTRGQSVIEFALVLPLILVLVFGITEFGRAWMAVNVLTSAAREGCRLAVVTAPDIPAVQARVTQVCNAAGIRDTAGPRQIRLTGIDVLPPDPLDPARRTTVTVRADFQVVTGRILGRFRGAIPLSATATMRHESL